ncbi:glycosyltransferase family 4 protein [Mumia sp. DW29H23]|uniref:glycosyltransferase family 4 protein n=1 Tax=Mumia sp. DW29H23 TaxID=3421241 RepID=UPI003D68614B
MTPVHLLVPEGVDDPRRPSGGNVYDRRLADALVLAGWTVREQAVRERGGGSLAAALASLPDESVVLADGIVTRGRSAVVAEHARRLHLVVLLHEPVGPDRDEGLVLESAAAVVATSRWTADRVAGAYGLDPRRLHVARPGVDTWPAHAGTDGGGRLLCVGAITEGKGQRELVETLGTLTDLAWECRIVGSPQVEPSYAREVARRTHDLGLDGRVTWTGPLVGDVLAGAYAAADLLVVPSRAETYGMVITEALAQGVPVVASAVGGVAEALGHTPTGAEPGMLVDAADPQALGRALRRWLTDPGLRTRLRQHARERRATLTGWGTTAAVVAGVLGALRREAVAT